MFWLIEAALEAKERGSSRGVLFGGLAFVAMKVVASDGVSNCEIVKLRESP
jgi:hypothetical protein